MKLILLYSLFFASAISAQGLEKQQKLVETHFKNLGVPIQDLGIVISSSRLRKIKAEIKPQAKYPQGVQSPI